MSPYSKTNWVANVTPVTAASMNNIEAGIASMAAPAPSTTPPATPADGDIWYLPADAANGVTWQFRYNAGSASAYKWEFVGGPPLAADVVTQETTTSASYVDLATAQVLTVPRAGDYVFSLGFDGSHSVANGGSQAAVRLAGTSTLPGGGTTCVSVAAGALCSGSKEARTTGRAAGDVLRLMFLSALVAGTATFVNRFYRLTPIRVS